jgi:cytochrome P450
MQHPQQCPVELISRRFMHDPYPDLAELRQSMPAAVLEAGGFRMWLISRYEDVRRILADPEVCKDMVGRRREIVEQSLVDSTRHVRLPHESRRSVLHRDGDDHRRLRGALTPMFRPEKLAGLREGIDERAEELLDRLPLGEPVDLLTAYVRPLVAGVIADLVGVPADEREMFPIWETAMLTSLKNEDVADAGRALYGFALRMIELKRAEPSDDVYSWLLGLHDDGTLDFDELASTFALLLFAGSEPAAVITTGISLLLRHPDQLTAVLTEPELWPNCVEEVLRYEPPFRNLPPRFSPKATNVGDVEVPSMELLLLSPASANRDATRFPDPDVFDVRRDTRGHLGFGHGSHRCPGAELGRLETQIALRAFFTRFPWARSLEEPSWRPGLFMRRLHSLPVLL